MELQHTPGKWYYGCEIAYGRDIYSDTGEYRKEWIASVNNTRAPVLRPKEEVEANARLIAAAPEMLEELIDCFKIFVAEKNYRAADYLKAIIEKATGKKIEEVI